MNCSRATANQTQSPHLHKQAFQSLATLLSHQYFTLHGDQSHQLQPSRCPRPNTQRGEWCLLYRPPLPSLWGSTQFDRPVFMAGLRRAGMNHEKDQNHLAGCSFILRVGQLSWSVCVAYVERMGLM